MRLFFGTELPPSARAALGRARPDDTRAEDHGYRWVDPSLLHVTLAFLGEQPAEALESLRAAAELTASEWREGAIRLLVDRFGQFGPRRAPRVLWAGLAGDVHGLARLHAGLVERLRRAGVPVADRSFAPHITLARRRDGALAMPPPWPPPAGPPLAVTVEHVSLFESKLAPTGPSYTVLDRFALT